MSKQKIKEADNWMALIWLILKEVAHKINQKLKLKTLKVH